jgi:hypothetical protein
MLVTERTAGPLADAIDMMNRKSNERDSLLAVAKEFRVDALRYRWLRDNTHSLSLLPVRANPNALYHEDSPKVWDSVIDNAMGKKT